MDDNTISIVREVRLTYIYIIPINHGKHQSLFANKELLIVPPKIIFLVVWNFFLSNLGYPLDSLELLY